MNSTLCVARSLISQQNRNLANSAVTSKTNKLWFSPLAKGGGRRFLSKKESRKRRKPYFKTTKNTGTTKSFEYHSQRHALASCLSKRDTHKFTSQLSKVSEANMPMQFLA
jgi:hypothetical protein